MNPFHALQGGLPTDIFHPASAFCRGHIQILFFLISGFVLLWMDVQQERTAGTKVLASLLASEDSVLKEIASYIEDARRAVATVANMDSSPQLRALCEQLLACMTKTD